MSHKFQESMSLAKPDAQDLSVKQKISVFIGVTSLFILILSLFNIDFPNKSLFLSLALGGITLGIIWFSNDIYLNKSKGIKNDGVWFKSISSKGFLGWVTGVTLTLFYIVLYFYPYLLGLGQKGDANTGMIALFDPLSKLLNGHQASQWFVYGTLYTLGILAFGYKFMLKYRHNRYQQLRTGSVMFFQLAFAFLIPEFMSRLNSESFSLPYYDLKSIWPLNYHNFEKYRIDEFINAGNIGLALLVFGVISIFMPTSEQYNYSIDGGMNFTTENIFSDLTPGEYFVVVEGEDGLCFYEDTVYVDECTLTSIDVEATNVSSVVVANGSIVITPTSGLSPYLYSVDGGQNFEEDNEFYILAVGNYNVVVQDASGACEYEVNVPVEVDESAEITWWRLDK